MAKEKTTIVSLDASHGTTFSLGEEVVLGNFHGVVEKIAFQGDRHKTVGSAYTPCYTIDFVDNTARCVIPQHQVVYILTDKIVYSNDNEDVSGTPELPDGEEENDD